MESPRCLQTDIEEMYPDPIHRHEQIVVGFESRGFTRVPLEEHRYFNGGYNPESEDEAGASLLRFPPHFCRRDRWPGPVVSVARDGTVLWRIEFTEERTVIFRPRFRNPADKEEVDDEWTPDMKVLVRTLFDEFAGQLPEPVAFVAFERIVKAPHQLIADEGIDYEAHLGYVYVSELESWFARKKQGFLNLEREVRELLA